MKELENSSCSKWNQKHHRKYLQDVMRVANIVQGYIPVPLFPALLSFFYAGMARKLRKLKVSRTNWMYKTLLTLRDTFNCNTSIVSLSWITSTPSVISCTFLCFQSDTVALPELFFTGLSNLYLLLLTLEILFALCHPLFALCHLLFRSPITCRQGLSDFMDCPGV